MQKRKLGQDGPMVGRIGLGCMSFGGMYGPTDEAESHATLKRALDIGVDHLDTAFVYGEGVSETVIGTFLKSNPGTFTIATKGGITFGPPRGVDNSPDYLRSCLETSLRRLGVDHVELYYVHRRAQATPVEETMEALVRFKEEGKIGAIGLSEISPATLRRASAIHPVAAVQNEYSLWTRQPELGLLQACRELGTTFVPFSPVARGMFAREIPDPATFQKFDFRTKNPRFVEPNFSFNVAYVERFRQYALARGHSPAALAVAWLLHRDDACIPIPGTRSADHLAELAEADAIRLSAAEMTEIETILPVGFAAGDRYADAQYNNVERYC
jgi:aryl-alcohol dehydrogenase-like predicted oxidoreductase